MFCRKHLFLRNDLSSNPLFRVSEGIGVALCLLQFSTQQNKKATQIYFFNDGMGELGKKTTK